MKRLSVFSTMLLFASLCTAQEPITLDLDTDEGLLILAPGEYTQAERSFGSLPVRDGEPAQGLTITLNAGDGLIFYGPTIETGPGDVLVECMVWCTGPDVGLALVTMNLPDYSMMANLPANGSKFMGGWHTMRLFCDPEDDTIIPAFQAVSTADPATDVSSVVYVDEIRITPIRTLEPEQLLMMFGFGVQPTPVPTAPATATPNPTDIPTPTPTLIPTGGGDAITVNLPGLPSGVKPLEMVLIDPGTFTMGSPSDERSRSSSEGPQHAVTLTQAFYLGKYEVTQAQWEAVMGSNPSSLGGEPNHPVVRVSWDDCQTFIERLNGLG